MPNNDENNAHARETLQAKLGYRFETPALFERALTHRSAGAVHNERLEFLGDSVLNFIIAAALFENDENAPEGDLTRQRASLVRERTLAAIAREIELAPALVLGSAATRNGSRRRDSLLADGLESLFGAIYWEAGFERVRAVVLALYAERLASLPSADSLKDAKTRLQEWLQARQRALPRYEVVKVSGAEHRRHFVARCILEDSDDALDGQGGGRRKAEQDAARRMLERLNSAKDGV